MEQEGILLHPLPLWRDPVIRDDVGGLPYLIRGLSLLVTKDGVIYDGILLQMALLIHRTRAIDLLTIGVHRHHVQPHLTHLCKPRGDVVPRTYVLYHYPEPEQLPWFYGGGRYQLHPGGIFYPALRHLLPLGLLEGGTEDKAGPAHEIMGPDVGPLYAPYLLPCGKARIIWPLG